MIFTPRLDEAIRLSAQLHRNQVRKDNQKTPYITHLFSVALIIAEVTDNEDIIIAGLMHDSLEDVPGYTYSKLTEDCGEDVAKIVQSVTEPLDPNKEETEQLPWLERKEKYLESLKSGGREGAIVSGADKIHNTESLLRGLEREKDEFLKRFSSSLRNKLWFHEQVLLIIEEKLGTDHRIVMRMKTCTEKFKSLLSEYEKG